MAKPKAYLAGAMSKLTYEQMNNWRLQATQELKEYGIESINPVAYYNFEMDESTYTEKEVKEFDLWAVKNSQIILVNLEYPDTIGTAIELQKAQDWGIPIIAFGRTVERPVHPWMTLCITKECKTMDEALNYIVEFYLPNIF